MRGHTKFVRRLWILVLALRFGVYGKMKQGTGYTLRGCICIRISVWASVESLQDGDQDTDSYGADGPSDRNDAMHDLPLVSREWRNGSNSSYNSTPFLHSPLTKGKMRCLARKLLERSALRTFRLPAYGVGLGSWSLWLRASVNLGSGIGLCCHSSYRSLKGSGY